MTQVNKSRKEISVDGKKEKWHEHKGKNAEKTKLQHHEVTVLNAMVI